MNMSLVLRLPRKIHHCRSSSNVPRLPSFLEMLQNPHVLLTFHKVHHPLHLPRETTSERPTVVRTPGVFNILTSKCASRHNSVHFFDIATSKVVRTWCVLCILTSTCASRHSGVHFFDIATSKSGPNTWCVFCTFWLRNVLRATTACNFSSLIWPAGFAPAALASLLFDPPEPQIIGKTQCFATAPTLSRTWIFFLLRLSLLWSSFVFSSLLWLFPSAFHLSILSEVWLLNFLRLSYLLLYDLINLILLCWTIYPISCYITLSCNIYFSLIIIYFKLYCLVLYCIVLYCVVLYCLVLYCVVLYCVVLYRMVLYCIVWYYCRASHTGDAIRVSIVVWASVWALVLFMCSARARRCRPQCDVLVIPQLVTILLLSHFCACSSSSSCCCCSCNTAYFRIFVDPKNRQIGGVFAYFWDPRIQKHRKYRCFLHLKSLKPRYLRW